MRRQLTHEESSTIAGSLVVDPTNCLVEAFREALGKISEIYPQFTMRDFSAVWVACHPRFVWDKETRACFSSCIKPEGKKGYWVLSEEVEEFPKKTATSKSSPNEDNLSAPWMKTALEEGMNFKIALRIKKKFPQESLEELASDVSELMLLWGKRGQCDEFLRKNKPPTEAILSIWAEQKIRQRVYKDGTDALHRELRGLRTQTEIRKRRERNVEDMILSPAMKVDPEGPKTVWVLREDQTREVVIIAPEVSAEVSAEVSDADSNRKFDFLRGFVRYKHKRSQDRFGRILDHMREGTPREEIALLEGCSELTVSHLLQKVRADLRKDTAFLKVVVELLKKISEEPFSTLEELKEENSSLEGSKIEKALEVLLLGEFIHENKGKSFRATEAGILLSQQV